MAETKTERKLPLDADVLTYGSKMEENEDQPINNLRSTE